MHIIKLEDAAEGDLFEEAGRALRDGGLVCFPCNGKYRLAADLNDVSAVMNLFQSKRRVGKAPALVFVTNDDMLRSVASAVTPQLQQLTERFWPGQLTILFDANPNLPRKVVKQLVRGNGQIGVRVPEDPIARGIVDAFGGPVLISSANRENKSGNTSPAQIRKNFVHKVDVFIEAGDLPGSTPSTVVGWDGESVRVTRPGSIPEADIHAAVA